MLRTRDALLIKSGRNSYTQHMQRQTVMTIWNNWGHTMWQGWGHITLTQLSPWLAEEPSLSLAKWSSLHCTQCLIYKKRKNTYPSNPIILYFYIWAMFLFPKLSLITANKKIMHLICIILLNQRKSQSAPSRMARLRFYWRVWKRGRKREKHNL